MRRLRTEGGSWFVIGLAVMFGGAGAYFGWSAVSKGDDTVGAAIALLGMAGVLLLLGRQEILTDLELAYSKIVVPAKVTAIVKSPTMNVNFTLHRWRLQAEGRLPDGRSRQFVSPYILAATQPDIAIGTIVDVNVSPRSGRYKMDLKSLARTNDGSETTGKARDAAGWRSRRFFIAGMIILCAWIGSAMIDTGNVGFGWVAVPLVACLFLLDMVVAFAAMQRRLRSDIASTWQDDGKPDPRTDEER